MENTKLEIMSRLRKASLYVESGEMATAYELWKETGPMMEKELGGEEDGDGSRTEEG